MNPANHTSAGGGAGGADRLREAFRTAALQSERKAAQFVSDPARSFPQLFLLRQDLADLELTGLLDVRCRVALGILEQKSGRAAQPEHSVPDQEQERRALKWMLDTGADWDGPAEGYDLFDAAVDAAATLLLCRHHDKSALPAVCALIFRRNRKGLLIHDLVWCLFRSCEAEAPRLVAQRLLSEDGRDVALACQLLHLPLPEANIQARRAAHRRYIAWLEENRDFLHFTGENFQQTAEPDPLEVDEEAKYLAKRIQPKTARPAEPLTDEEWTLLERFRALAPEERALLAEHSGRLHRRDVRAWGGWIRSGPDRQLKAAKAEGGGQA